MQELLQGSLHLGREKRHLVSVYLEHATIRVSVAAESRKVGDEVLGGQGTRGVVAFEGYLRIEDSGEHQTDGRDRRVAQDVSCGIQWRNKQVPRQCSVGRDIKSTQIILARLLGIGDF